MLKLQNMSKRKLKICPPETKYIIVSACLLGVNCCYDGKDRKNNIVMKLNKNYNLIKVCPEVMGGLPTPRACSEIRGGDGRKVLNNRQAKVFNEKGKDVTSNFLEGARKTLQIAKKKRAKFAILKSKSPACGAGRIYNGSFSKKLKRGDGVATALLKENGIKVFTEKQIKDFLKEVNHAKF